MAGQPHGSYRGSSRGSYRGSYRYALAGRTLDITETFELDLDPWRLTGVRTSAGVTLTVEATADRAVVTWRDAEREVVRTVARGEADVLHPLLRAAQGRAIVASEGGAVVRVPDVRPGTAALLSPLDSHRTAARQPDGSWSWEGGDYDASARFWVDGDGLLTRYTWDQPGVGPWEVALGTA